MAKQFKVSVTTPTTAKRPENFEEILESLGGFGKAQVVILFLLLILEVPTAFLVFVPVFIGATPTEWLCDNETISRASACTCKGSLTPVDPTSSIVTEWSLICGSSWVSDTVTSLQMSGMLFGNMFVSQLSDWYGRKWCFLGITMTMVLGSILTAASPNVIVYAISRFICGAGFSGFLSLTAVYSMEFMTPRYRPVCSSVGPFGEGVMLLGLLAYLIRPWRTLMWVTIAPFAAIIFIFPFVPESPRWLLRQQRIEDCHKVLSFMARMNGKEPVDIPTLRYISEKEKQVEETSRRNSIISLGLANAGQGAGRSDVEKEVKGASADAVQRFTYLDFCRNPVLRRTTLFLQAIWFSWGIVYFGISYNIKNLPGNTYLNVVYMGMVDAIAYPTAMLINNRLGRRKALVASMTLAAAFLVAIAVLQLTINMEGFDTLVLTLYLLGKFGTAGARCAARTLTGESFPTAIRVMGIGFAGSTASLGGALAPQLAFLGSMWPSVPFFAFAVISVMGSLVSFLLTETSGRPLEEEVQQKKKKGEGDNIKIQSTKERKLSMGTILPLPSSTALSPIIEEKFDKEKTTPKIES